jgi:hypothetical protein
MELGEPISIEVRMGLSRGRTYGAPDVVADLEPDASNVAHVDRLGDDVPWNDLLVLPSPR